MAYSLGYAVGFVLSLGGIILFILWLKERYDA